MSSGGKILKIKLTSVYVDDQDKALRIYTEVLGLTKKADFRNGPFRWLTVASTEESTGTELQLAPARARPREWACLGLAIDPCKYTHTPAPGPHTISAELNLSEGGGAVSTRSQEGDLQ